jgi:hypothetical protein
MGGYMKQQILGDICTKLDELQIPFSVKDDSYIYVNTDFYEIGSGAEFKKITYELTVMLDETARAVSMYVKTVDQCLVTASGDTRVLTSPSTTIFRKVKRYCYDKDGRGAVVTTDLGEVPNTVKNTAFRCGWKFSTALNLNKLRKTVESAVVSPRVPDEPELPAIEEPAAPAAKPEAAVRKRKKSAFGRIFGGK